MQNETDIYAPRNVTGKTLEGKSSLGKPFEPYVDDVQVVDGPARIASEPAPYIDPRLVGPDTSRRMAPMAADTAIVPVAPTPLIGALSDRDFLAQFMDRPEQRALIRPSEKQAPEIFGYFSTLDIAAGIAAAIVMIGPLAAAAIGAIMRG